MSDTSAELTDASALQHRSLAKQVVFTIVTFGVYSLYWWYVTNKQLQQATDAGFSPAMRTIGLFIPVYNLVVIWRFAHDAEVVTDQSGAVLFLLYIVIAPVAWYLIQSGINAIAQEQAA